MLHSMLTKSDLLTKSNQLVDCVTDLSVFMLMCCPGTLQARVQQLLPCIQATVRRHISSWAAESASAGCFAAQPAAKALAFEVLANDALQIKLITDEVSQYSRLLQVSQTFAFHS
jgi:hypothetical protein